MTGIHKHVEELAQGLNTLGHDVTVTALSSGLPVNSIKMYEKDGLKWIVLPLPSTFFKREFLPLNDALFWSRYGRMLKEGYDIVHIHGAVASPLKMVMRRPLIATNHGIQARIMSYGTPSGLATSIHCSFERLFGSIAYNFLINRIIAVSELVSKEVQHYYMVPKRKIDTIPNGVDTKIFKPLPKEELVDFRRRFDLEGFNVLLFIKPIPRKNLHGLLLALPSVLKEFPRTKLLVVGSIPNGKYWQLIKSIIDRKNLNDHIVFTGFLKEGELVYAYNSADIFILPSLYEALPMVYLEAMACGVPVIGTTECAEEVIVDGLTGFRVDPKNIRELSEKIIRLLGEVGLRKNLGLNALTHVKKNFSWPTIVARTLDCYLDVSNNCAYEGEKQ
jgi:glycosyltransferase involved in cell wall biosynthesis